MTLLHLIDIPWWSGLSSYAFDCMAAHQEMGHKVILLCEKKSLSEKRARRMGIPVFAMGGRRFWSAPFNFLAIGLRLAQARPKMIVAHTGSTHWMAVIWGGIFRMKVARTRAVAQRIQSGMLNRLVYGGTDWVVAASENLKNQYAEKLSLNGRLKAFLPPVANPGLASPGPLQARPPSNKKIGVLARLDPKKGHFDIIDALAQVQKRHPDMELHIAGAEENLPWKDLSMKAAAAGLRNIWYHGFLEYEKIWEFMDSCRFGLIASRESEEVSRALLEWMSAGRAVVASKVGCIPEILKDGEGGFLFEPGDVAGLAEKADNLLAGADLAVKMGQINLERAAKDFAPARFKAQWHEVLYA